MYLVETWQVVTRTRGSNMRKYIIVIIACMALFQACLWGEFDITMLYVRHRPLLWTASQYGYFLAGGYFTSGIHLSLLVVRLWHHHWFIPIYFAALGTLFLLPFLSGYFKFNDYSLALVAEIGRAHV